MSGSNINISSIAACKMVLHAARYSHLAVNGVLLGSQAGGDILISDAVPLFHHTLALAPMLDVALTQIEEKFSSQGLAILGYYQANENVRDLEPDFIAFKITEKIAENCSAACLIMIDNRALSPNLETGPFTVSQLMQDGKWKAKDRHSVTLGEDALAMAGRLMHQHKQHDIADFDLHLDDISLDWANPQINKLVSSSEAA